MTNKRSRSSGVCRLLSIGLGGLLALNTLAAADKYPAENPGTEGDGDFTVGPDYKIDPDLTDQGNPKGKNFEFSMALADSKIFKGDHGTLEPEKKAVRTERKI